METDYINLAICFAVLIVALVVAMILFPGKD